MLFSKQKERAAMTDDLPRDITVPLPVPHREPTPPPVEYRRPVPAADDSTTREIMVRAAEAYDNTQRVIGDLQAKLADTQLHLREKTRMIEHLELQLIEERSRIVDYRTERDDAVQDRADMLAFLSTLADRINSIGTALERFDFPSRKRKRTKPAAAAIEASAPTNGSAAAEPAESVSEQNTPVAAPEPAV